MLQKKHLLIIGVILIILVVGLGGCFESSNTEINEKSLFIGVWKMLEPEGQDHNTTLIALINQFLLQMSPQITDLETLLNV